MKPNIAGNLTEKTVRDNRYNICKTCEDYKFKLCKHCNCVMEFKTWIVESKCPIGKW